MASELQVQPAQDLESVLATCDPTEPLRPGDSRYADFGALRHGTGLHTLQNDLRARTKAKGGCQHRCLCGHRGSGKSTELLSLKKWADQNGFLAAHAEVDGHFGMIELEFSDLFLLAGTMAESAMEGIGKPLPKEKIKLIVEWFSDVIHEDDKTVHSEIAAEVGGQLGGKLPLGLGKLFAKFTAGTKAASSHALKTRQKIRNYPQALIDKTNDLLRTANESLRSERSNGLLLLFDNLDRYEPDRINKVLFRGSALVESLACHAVFTIPIALEYESTGPIQDCYGFSVVLPMLALRRKDHAWKADVPTSPFDPRAIEVVREALAQRVDLALFEDPIDIDLLVKMSGGCLRDLMHLVTLSFSQVEESSRFTRDSIRRAIQQMRATYLRRLTDDDYARLAAIGRRESVPRDDQTIRLLFNRYALEYLDDDHSPWMDVHPLVVETEKFRRAYDAKPKARAPKGRKSGR